MYKGVFKEKILHICAWQFCQLNLCEDQSLLISNFSAICILLSTPAAFAFFALQIYESSKMKFEIQKL